MRYFFFLLLHTNACLAIPTTAPALSYADVVKDVGFDIRTITSNAKTASLSPPDMHAFMNQASQLKSSWQKDNITVHPLTLFLATAMDLGNQNFIRLGNEVIKSYESDKGFITQVFGWRWSDKQGNSREQTIYDATNKMAASLTSAPAIQVIQPISRAYLDYRLSEDFAKFEHLGAVIKQHAPTQYHAVIEALCGKNLAKIWGEEERNKEAKQNTARYCAAQYQVFSPLNPLAPVNTPYLIVREADLAAHKANLGVHFAAKPSLTMVVDYGLATAINTSPALPNSVHHISFVGPQVTTIGNSFLKERTLKTVDLSGLSELTSIGSAFLFCCEALEALDFHALSGITTIGDGFLANCKALKAVNLSPLSKVTTIGNYFFANCDALESVCLKGLSRVATIGDKFLFACTALTSVGLSELSSLTTIGSFFLGSTGLISVNFSGLSGVTKIGDKFLYGCPALTSVGFSGLSGVTKIGDKFLAGCDALKALDLSALDKVTTIGRYCLENEQKDPITITGIPAPAAWALIKAQITRPITLA